MLVLARKVGQKIRIGEAIEMTIVEIHHGVVRLGFTAPRDVPIHRQEVYEQIYLPSARPAGSPTPEIDHLP